MTLFRKVLILIGPLLATPIVFIFGLFVEGDKGGIFIAFGYAVLAMLYSLVVAMIWAIREYKSRSRRWYKILLLALFGGLMSFTPIRYCVWPYVQNYQTISNLKHIEIKNVRIEPYRTPKGSLIGYEVSFQYIVNKNMPPNVYFVPRVSMYPPMIAYGIGPGHRRTRLTYNGVALTDYKFPWRVGTYDYYALILPRGVHLEANGTLCIHFDSTHELIRKLRREIEGRSDKDRANRGVVTISPKPSYASSTEYRVPVPYDVEEIFSVIESEITERCREGN